MAVVCMVGEEDYCSSDLVCTLHVCHTPSIMKGPGGRGALEDAIHRIRARPKNTGHIVQLFRAV